MNKIKRFLIGATAGAIMFGSMAMPALAHQGHASCNGFGEDVSSTVQSIDKPGKFISTFVPVNDDVAAEHTAFCTAK